MLEKQLEELKQRRIFTWFDFIDEEVEPKVAEIGFDKEEQAFLDKKIAQGTEYQRELNEDFMPNACYSVEYYLKSMRNYILLQDQCISEIREYIANVEQWKNEQKPKKSKKTNSNELVTQMFN